MVETINAGQGILTYSVGRDTVAFTDFPFKGKFERDATGQITGLRMLGLGEVALMARLKPDERLPGEWLRAGRVAEAVAGYRALKLNEYQLTYMAYDLLNGRPANLAAAEGLLNLAMEQFPQSAIVFARLGDLRLRQGDKAAATSAYQTSLRLNPDDKELREKVLALTK